MTEVANDKRREYAHILQELDHFDNRECHLTDKALITWLMDTRGTVDDFSMYPAAAGDMPYWDTDAFETFLDKYKKTHDTIQVVVGVGWAAYHVQCFWEGDEKGWRVAVLFPSLPTAISSLVESSINGWE